VEPEQEDRERKRWEDAWHAVMVIEWIRWVLMMVFGIPLVTGFIWLLFEMGFV
jgi:hypothetical protein